MKNVEQVESGVLRVMVGDTPRYLVGQLVRTSHQVRISRYRGRAGKPRQVTRTRTTLVFPAKATGRYLTGSATRAAELGWTYAEARKARARATTLAAEGGV